MKSRADRPPAVIVGMDINGLGVARALSQHRIPCIALTPHWEPCCATRTAQIRISKEWTPEGIVDELKKIGASLERKAVLLITSDDVVPWISEAREALAPFYEFNLPS